MNIISASRRSDIPAFFADWFMARIRAGYFHRVNPFNRRQITRVSLAPEEVAAFVFWTKDPRPLLPHLAELDRRGFRYYFHFTLNPYDATFEPHTPPLQERIATFRELAGRIGPERVIWRYDPIIVSSITPVAYHLQRAGEIAAALHGSTERLVVSFLDFYGKVMVRLRRLAERSGLVITDMTAAGMRDELERLVSGLKVIADGHGLRLFSCAEELDLAHFGIEHGSCIDGGLIRELTGSDRRFVRDRNQRPACRCVKAVDMGMYNTCRFACVYCYANQGAAAVRANLARHSPCGAALVGE